jgi:hypothetical protein
MVLLVLLLAAGSVLPAGAADPELAFSTFLGGSDSDWGRGIAVDGRGHVWVLGTTSSSDFPTYGSPLPSGSRADVFVARFDSSGTLLWLSTFGGSGEDEGQAIALDPAGNAYVVGMTRALPGDPLDFPRVGPLPLPSQPGSSDAFVAKIDPSGALVYSALLGGSGWDSADGVAVDAAGAAWVVGYTLSQNFPQVVSLSPELQGSVDAFVVRIDPTGSALTLSTYLGGGGEERAYGVAVDGSGRAHVVGYTFSPGFPTLPAVPPPSGQPDIFVTTFAPSGALVRSRLLAGGEESSPYAVATDAAGQVFVFGSTSSPDFPVVGAFQPGTSGAFLMRFDATGALVSSTLLGDLFLRPFDLEVDPGGTIHLAGYASPDGGARLVRIDPAITRILDVVTLAGTESGQDAAYGVAADARGTSYLTGITGSPDFPTRNPAQPALAGEEDAFVAGIAASTSNSLPDCDGAMASPGSLWPPNGKLRPIAIGGVTDPDGDRVTLRVTAIRQDEPLSKKGQPDASGIGTARPLVRADRAGRGDGRVYHLTFTAEDGKGGRCEGTVTVCVPHDQKKRICQDGGARFDSSGR